MCFRVDLRHFSGTEKLARRSSPSNGPNLCNNLVRVPQVVQKHLTSFYSSYSSYLLLVVMVSNLIAMAFNLVASCYY